jgi:hypothetical protein
MHEGGVARLTLPVAERDHVQGPATALVTLVEYGDLRVSVLSGRSADRA